MFEGTCWNDMEKVIGTALNGKVVKEGIVNTVETIKLSKEESVDVIYPISLRHCLKWTHWSLKIQSLL